jgi:hypothetical protein
MSTRDDENDSFTSSSEESNAGAINWCQKQQSPHLNDELNKTGQSSLASSLELKSLACNESSSDDDDDSDSCELKNKNENVDDGDDDDDDEIQFEDDNQTNKLNKKKPLKSARASRPSLSKKVDETDDSVIFAENSSGLNSQSNSQISDRKSSCKSRLNDSEEDECDYNKEYDNDDQNDDYDDEENEDEEDDDEENNTHSRNTNRKFIYIQVLNFLIIIINLRAI